MLANSNSTAVTSQPFLRADFFLPPTIWRSHKGAGNECPEQDGKFVPAETGLVTAAPHSWEFHSKQ